MSQFAGYKSTKKAKAIYSKTLGEDYGEFSLGRNTTKILNEDPKLLLFTLSRYKFVAKMFNGFNNVLEIGCQEGFGAIIVGQAVKHIHGVDFYIPYIESCKRRIHSEKISFEAADMLDGSIRRNFDGAFALDVIEHIDKKDEDIFMMNICESINDDGALILGMPSLESQVYASEASKIGHVNCKSGDQLREFTKKYFKNVFSFNMNDEILHTGFFPMSQYLFVLACSKR